MREQSQVPELSALNGELEKVNHSPVLQKFGLLAPTNRQTSHHRLGFLSDKTDGWQNQFFINQTKFEMARRNPALVISAPF